MLDQVVLKTEILCMYMANNVMQYLSCSCEYCIFRYTKWEINISTNSVVVFYSAAEMYSFASKRTAVNKVAIANHLNEDDTYVVQCRGKEGLYSVLLDSGTWCSVQRSKSIRKTHIHSCSAEAEFLDEIQTQTHATSYSFQSSVTKTW
jgi:hypothetical protein